MYRYIELTIVAGLLLALALGHAVPGVAKPEEPEISPLGSEEVADGDTDVVVEATAGVETEPVDPAFASSSTPGMDMYESEAWVGASAGVVVVGGRRDTRAQDIPPMDSAEVERCRHGAPRGDSAVVHEFVVGGSWSPMQDCSLSGLVEDSRYPLWPSVHHDLEPLRCSCDEVGGYFVNDILRRQYRGSCVDPCPCVEVDHGVLRSSEGLECRSQGRGGFRCVRSQPGVTFEYEWYLETHGSDYWLQCVDDGCRRPRTCSVSGAVWGSVAGRITRMPASSAVRTTRTAGSQPAPGL